MERDMDDERRPGGRPSTVLGRALVAALLVLVLGPLSVANAAEPEPEEAPVVTTQPASQEVTEPGSAVFTAAASGTPTPTVQWEVAEFGEFFLDEPGATSDTLTITSPTVPMSGYKYRARFTNPTNPTLTTVSNAATLTVGPAPVAPAVVTQPTSQEVTEHGTAMFTAAASGIPKPTIKWQVSQAGGKWTEVPGATSETMSVPNATSSESGNVYRAVFTNSAGSATSAEVTLTVNSAPRITSGPKNVTVRVGETAKFTATAEGTPPPTVRWEVSTNEGATYSEVPEATSEKLSITNTTIVESGDRYVAVFTNKAGSVSTSEVTLTVDAIPAVSASPSNVTVLAGEDATFKAAAVGPPTPTVQWQVSTDGGNTFTNDTTDSGYNTEKLTITAATVAKNGYEYRAAFTNWAGTTSSQPATLSVDAAPVVISNPTSKGLRTGETAKFTATASGTPTPTVQWQVSQDFGVTWENDTSDPGNATGTLAVTASSVEQNGYEYRAMFSNSAGTAASAIATLTVTEKLTAPVVTGQPASKSVIAGEAATFTATASGTPTPTVAWQISTDGGKTFTNDTTDAGHGTGTLTILAVGVSENKNEYRAVFTNSVGTGTSAPATLTVAEKTAAPVVTLDPVAKVVTAGKPATFTATASGVPTPKVQWQVSPDLGVTWENDTNDSGSTTGTLEVASAKVAQSGDEYRAVFTNSVATVASNGAILTVHAAPIVTSQPTSTSVIQGEGATFTAAASGAPPPTVQWQVSTDGGKTFTNDTSDEGATTDRLTIPAAGLSKNKNEYHAIFTNSVGSGTSVAATLTVAEKTVAPVVTVDPVRKIVAAGEAATFTSGASGVPTPKVQWQVSSDLGLTWENDTSDSVSPTGTLTIAPTVVAENGYEYRAVFTNSVGTVASNGAILTVHAAPIVTIEPVSTSVFAGETATFTAAASGGPTPTVQWQFSTNGSAWTNDNTDSGSTTTTLTVPGAAVAQSGYQYRAVFTNTVGVAMSTPATLTVSPRPVAARAPVPPVASFTWFPSSPHVGESVSLASNSTDVDSPIAASAWDLAGSGPFVAGSPVVTTTFTTPGSHTVRLRVTDATGLSSVATQRIQVTSVPLLLMQPFPVIRIAGSDSAFGVKLSLVTVQAPIGAHITVTCKGHGCPARSVSAIAIASKKRRGGPAAVVAFRRFERTLRAGVTLEIRVTKPGQIGKYTGFSIRRGKLPVRVDMCLGPAASQPMVCPSS